MKQENEVQIRCQRRVAEYGEVFTGKREVTAMLDLVKQETERIESRFLEPACGTGNFLSEILSRKLNVVKKRYAKSQYDFELYAIVAVSSIYGIDIQEENVLHCRERLFGIFEAYYLELFKNQTKDDCRASVQYILSRNIIHGNALSLETVGDNPQPIIFSEWSPINSSLIKRRDFTFSELMSKANLKDDDVPSIFEKEDTIIPGPEKEYPPVHFLELANAFN